MATRFVLEGEWTGYTSSQSRVVHREVVTGKRVEALKNLHTIIYTDGTSLLLHLREAKPREKVQEVKSYTSLINDALRVGKARVLVAELRAVS